MWKKPGIRYVLPGALCALALWAVVRPRALTVESAIVTRGPMNVTIDEEGRTRVRERYVVAAPVTGRIDRIRLHEGDAVRVGMVLARMIPSPLDPRARAQAQARLRAALAARLAAGDMEQRARAAFDQAHRDRERVEQLGREGLQPEETRERAALQEAVAASELSAASHAVEAAIQEAAEARATLLASSATSAPGQGSVAVLSTTSGTVLRVLQESDRVLDAGTPLFEIGDLADMEVVTEMLSSDAMLVRPGSLMWIGGLLERDREVEGRVRRVEPSGFTKLSALGVEEQRVNVVGDFMAPPDRIGDGYRVEVRVLVWSTPSAILVPGSALYRDGPGWRVFVIEGGRAVSREVEIDHRTSFLAEVRRGLAAGETVILYPGDRVAEGMRVTSQAR